VERPTMLITGCLGDLWYSTKYHIDTWWSTTGLPNADLMRADLGLHSLTEVRLQAGYVQLAFPYIGGRSMVDIFRITESEEMSPWQLQIAYDRPIPRRIAEQAGLQRDMFGQKKTASVLEYPFPTIPINKQLQLDYLDFLVQKCVLARWQILLLPLVRKWNSIIWTTSPRRHVWNYYLERALSKLLHKEFSFPLVYKQLDSSLFCFCVNRRIKDYRSVL